MSSRLEITQRYVTDESRNKTMRKRLGKAVDLISNDKYLKLYRNRQKRFPDEFRASIEVAKTKKCPSAYFAVMWAVRNVERTVKWMKQFLCRRNAAQCDIMADRKVREVEQLHPINHGGRAKYKALVSKPGLFGAT